MEYYTAVKRMTKIPVNWRGLLTRRVCDVEKKAKCKRMSVGCYILRKRKSEIMHVSSQ